MERIECSEAIFPTESARKHGKGRKSTRAPALLNLHTHEVTGSSPVVRTKKETRESVSLFLRQLVRRCRPAENWAESEQKTPVVQFICEGKRQERKCRGAGIQGGGSMKFMEKR